MKRLSWQSEWKTGDEDAKKTSGRGKPSIWLSALQNVMSDAVCCFLDLIQEGNLGTDQSG